MNPTNMARSIFIILPMPMGCFMGAPQDGHWVAFLLISLLHSLQVVSDMLHPCWVNGYFEQLNPL